MFDQKKKSGNYDHWVVGTTSFLGRKYNFFGPSAIEHLDQKFIHTWPMKPKTTIMGEKQITHHYLAYLDQKQNFII